MPFYTTVALVQATLPKAVNSMSSVTSSTVAHFINQTDSIINGNLAKLYTTPVSYSPMLETIATDLSCHRLLRRLFTQEKKNSSSWVDDFAHAIDDLKAIADGDLSLVDDSGALIAKAVGQVWSNNQGFNPTMDEGNINNSYVDPDKLDAISAAKAND